MKTSHYDEYVRIGLNILYYRKQQGLTQEQLAERISYSKNHVQQVETAKAVPSVEILLDIADALGIPAAKLLEER